MQPLKLLVLGPPRLERGDQPVALGLRRAVALLVYLAVTGRPQSRDTLAGLLWPDGDEQEARSRLRRTLHRLTEPLGENIVQADGDTLCLSPQADLWVDSRAFDQHAAAGLAAPGDEPPSAPDLLDHLTEAAELYVDDFLAGFTVSDSPAWDEWQFLQREQLRQSYARVLTRLVRIYRERESWETAIGYARRRLALDPLHEPAHRTLMRLYVLAGQQAAALRQYQECARLLRAELGIEPEEQTTALFEAIRARRLVTSVARRHDRSPDERLEGSDGPPPAAPARDVAAPPGPPLRDGGPAEERSFHSLPVFLTRFVGRQAECAELGRLLAGDAVEPRLVTLTGEGGSGKTRLALEAATLLVPEYSDGVWLVDLTALRDPSLVPQALASTLGLRDEPSSALIDTLARQLRTKRMLLVFDNCEHLLDACAELIDRLLRGCPQLRILTTSRQALGIGGEIVRRVTSLRLPESREPPLEELASYEAIQLFLDRASSGQPAFSLTSRNAPSVVAICQHLDGLPLALELAAARVRVLSVEQIAARLDDRFRLLTSGSRTAPRRQQTLRAAVEWSYDLLSRPEQKLFNRFAVFAGGWSLEAAEVVCADEPHPNGAADEDLPTDSILDLLSQLVEKSLVIASTSPDGVTRYRLLETLRQFGHEHLVASGEDTAVRSKHAHFFLALAEESESKLIGPDQVRWLDFLEREHDNLRAALEWSAGDDCRPEFGLRLAAAIWRFWWLRGHLAEGRARLEQFLELAGPSGRAEVRAKALSALGVLAFRQGDQSAARLHFEQQLALATALGDRQSVAATLRSLGRMAIDRGDFETAGAQLEESLTLERQLGNSHGEAWSLSYLGLLRYFQGESATAVQSLDESLARMRGLDDHLGIAVALYYLGRVVRDQQDFERAHQHLGESLTLCCDQRLLWPIPYLLEAFADLAVARGRAARGVTLAGAAARLHETIGAPLPPVWRADFQHRLEPVRQVLDESTRDGAWAVGLSMTLEQAASFALAGQAD